MTGIKDVMGGSIKVLIKKKLYDDRLLKVI